MFTTKFDKFVCIGDTITTESEGFTIKARIVEEYYIREPWKEYDGHGVVSEWVHRNKRPGERILSSDRGSHRYYDIAASMKIAKRDGWDAEPYGTGTADEQAARAVERDFEVLRAWCNDEWCYCCVVLSVSKNGITLDDHAACLGGVEMNYPGSDNSYLSEVANELLGEAIEAGRQAMVQLLRS